MHFISRHMFGSIYTKGQVTHNVPERQFLAFYFQYNRRIDTAVSIVDFDGLSIKQFWKPGEVHDTPV